MPKKGKGMHPVQDVMSDDVDSNENSQQMSNASDDCEAIQILDLKNGKYAVLTAEYTPGSMTRE